MFDFDKNILTGYIKKLSEPRVLIIGDQAIMRTLGSLSFFIYPVKIFLSKSNISLSVFACLADKILYLVYMI